MVRTMSRVCVLPLVLLLATHTSLADDTVTGLFTAPGDEIVPLSYTYGSIGPHGNYPDTGGNELIDGDKALSISYTNATEPRWVGLNQPPADDGLPQPQLTFNFGTQQAIDSIVVNYLDYAGGASIFSPDSLDLSVSNDGLTFTPVGSFTGFIDSTPNAADRAIRDATYDFPAQTAQFFRVELFNDQAWTFISEVDFFEFTPPPLTPEPASFMLFGAVFALLIGGIVRRQRRNQPRSA